MALNLLATARMTGVVLASNAGNLQGRDGEVAKKISYCSYRAEHNKPR